MAQSGCHPAALLNTEVGDDFTSRCVSLSLISHLSSSTPHPTPRHNDLHVPAAPPVRLGRANPGREWRTTMSEIRKLTRQLSVVSMAGGIAGFTFARSFPSLFGGLGVGAAMAVAGLRIADGQDYGYALACVSSVGLAVPMVR